MLFIHCLLWLPFGVGNCVQSFALCVLSCLAIILLRKREPIDLLFAVAVADLCLFLTVQWVGLRSVIVALPSYTHLSFVISCEMLLYS